MRKRCHKSGANNAYVRARREEHAEASLQEAPHSLLCCARREKRAGTLRREAMTLRKSRRARRAAAHKHQGRNIQGQQCTSTGDTEQQCTSTGDMEQQRANAGDASRRSMAHKHQKVQIETRRNFSTHRGFSTRRCLSMRESFSPMSVRAADGRIGSNDQVPCKRAAQRALRAMLWYITPSVTPV